MAKTPADPKPLAAFTKAQWLLVSIAAVALLSIGLLGGILIGQQTNRFDGFGGSRTAQVFVHEGYSGQQHIQQRRIPDKLKDRMQDLRDAPQHLCKTPSKNPSKNSGSGSPSPSPSPPATP